MAKIKDITIIDSKLLRLDVDAVKGDIIDLEEINQVDLSMLSDKIKRAYEVEFNKLLESEKVKYSKDLENKVLQKEIEFSGKLKEVEEQKLKLSIELENVSKKIKDEVELRKLEYMNEVNEKIKNLELELQSAKDQLKLSVIEKEAELDKKDLEIKKLVLEKSALSVKKIGERLELWCNEEYLAYSQSGFVNCTWEKDNDSVKNDGDTKGSKADFIFKVYANEDFNDSNLLTSVVLEMKSESPDSINKKKNADHFDKLEKDRKKKGCEYALLVSELEWDNDNDVPIKKVQKYDKMYVVRPNYFIPFLSIIEGLGKKYQNLLLKRNEEVIQFKESQIIIDEFEKFKEDLISKFIDKMNKDLDAVIKQAEAIQTSSIKIMEACEDMKNRLVKNCLNKIEKLDITKLIRKIEKL